jgi:hypothetical protein
MQKSFFKLYVITFLFILALASFGFAGNGQCPLTDDPPPVDGGEGNLVQATDPNSQTDARFDLTTDQSSQIIVKTFIEFIDGQILY